MIKFFCQNKDCRKPFLDDPAKYGKPDVLKIRCPSCGNLNEYPKKNKGDNSPVVPSPIEERKIRGGTQVINADNRDRIKQRIAKVDPSVAIAWLVELVLALKEPDTST